MVSLCRAALVGAAVLLGPASWSVRARLSAASPRWAVSLERARPCPVCPAGVSFEFSVTDRLTGTVSRFTLANAMSGVTEIRVPRGGNTAALVERSQEGWAFVTVVALPSGRVRDAFLCVWPSFSPGDRFMAFRKWFPAHLPPEVHFSDEYLIYDLMKGPLENRAPGPGCPCGPGFVLYPPGALNGTGPNIVRGRGSGRAHRIASTSFFWLGADTVAFVDRYRGVNRLIVADLRRGVRDPRVNAVPLAASGLVDFTTCAEKVAPSDLARWQRDPALLIFAKSIRELRGQPPVVQVDLFPNPCLASSVVDVRAPWLVRSRRPSHARSP